jgi:hypothetical protein
LRPFRLLPDDYAPEAVYFSSQRGTEDTGASGKEERRSMGRVCPDENAIVRNEDCDDQAGREGLVEG